MDCQCQHHTMHINVMLTLTRRRNLSYKYQKSKQNYINKKSTGSKKSHIISLLLSEIKGVVITNALL